MGVLWWCVWWLRSWEKPASCPSITEEEKNHIEESLGVNDKAGREAQEKVGITLTSIILHFPRGVEALTDVT